ncbi:ABC transporter permease [Jiangella asiatica]|uniref:ABC transporter permease subunit n=1 Tax=Jiangella asiatica TaxID=2530372 RepID=A0A4R5DTX9_9ACTN|nr:ABC transporter permease subunit [Jiangella asiatica]TDE14363.1 ABC transporter permease subunit [Jiangella asiatica]
MPITLTRPGRRVVRRQATIWALRLALLLAVLGAWRYANTAGEVSPLILPQLSAVTDSFTQLVGSSHTWQQAGITVLEMLAAFTIAAVGGLLCGFLLSRGPVIARTAEPLLAWGYMFPLALLYPLFLLWVGVGMGSKIAYAAVGAFFPITYNTIRGLRSVDAKYLQVGRAFGASSLQVDFNIKFGAARPMILAGLRIGSSIVTIFVVLAELLGSQKGLGHEIEQASSRLMIADSYATVLLLILITIVLQRVMERLLRAKHE